MQPVRHWTRCYTPGVSYHLDKEPQGIGQNKRDGLGFYGKGKVARLLENLFRGNKNLEVRSYCYIPPGSLWPTVDAQ